MLKNEKDFVVRDGLSLIVDMGFLYVGIERDALMVVFFLALSSIPHPSLRTLVDDCRFLLQRIPHKELKHVFREANKCTDRLAKLGGSQEDDFVVLNTPLHVFVMSYLLTIHGALVPVTRIS